MLESERKRLQVQALMIELRDAQTNIERARIRQRLEKVDVR